MRYAWLCLVAALAAGCGSKPKDQMLPLDQVPENVLKVAQEKLPGVQFEQAVRRADGRYEVRGRDKKGKVREIDVSPGGEVLEIE